MTKIIDKNPAFPGLSHKERYWYKTGYRNLVKRIRPGISLPGSITSSEDLVRLIKSYGFRGVEFGKWVTEEDKFNYLTALYFAIYDLNKILRFDKNLGMDGMVTIAYGSRGYGGSTAHFMPSTNVININRYHRSADNEKPAAFTMGGIQALAHEYGHALDFILGGRVERSTQSYPLTLGKSTRTKWDNSANKTPMRKLMSQLIHGYIWKDETEKEFTESYKKIEREKDYFREHCEIFARLFEKYIYMKLQARGIKNTALTHSKYTEKYYATDKDMKKLMPVMDNLVNEMRKQITVKSSRSTSEMKAAASGQQKLFSK